MISNKINNYSQIEKIENRYMFNNNLYQVLKTKTIFYLLFNNGYLRDKKRHNLPMYLIIRITGFLCTQYLPRFLIMGNSLNI